jgi:hypothetical protein
MKLMAWQTPAVYRGLQNGSVAAAATKASKVLGRQKQLAAAARATLDSVYADVREGLSETVGINCTLEINDRCSVALELPDNTDTALIARAIDLENVESWLDEAGRVNRPDSALCRKGNSRFARHPRHGRGRVKT